MSPSHSLSQDLVASGLIADHFLHMRRSARAPSSRPRAARLSRLQQGPAGGAPKLVAGASAEPEGCFRCG